MGEETGGGSFKGDGAVLAGIGCPEGVSGMSLEVGVSSWNIDGGEDGGGESRFTSIEAGRGIDVP